MEQIRSMFLNVIKMKKPDLDQNVSSVPAFKDQKQISPWAVDIVKAMYKHEIIQGLPDGRFDPQGKTTREQAVVLVVKTYEKYLTR